MPEIPQGEGGEQGDVPALFSCQPQCFGGHAGTVARFGERLMTFLDDIYAKSHPERSATVSTAIQDLLRVGIRVHDGKTQLWNRS